MTFDEVIGAYASVRSSSRDAYSLKRLLPHFAGRSIRDLKRVHVRAYVSARLADGVKPATVRREIRLASAAVNFVKLELEVDLPNPFAALGLEVGEGRVRWITRLEASALVSACRQCIRPHLAVFVLVALNTGARRGELLGLEWSRVDFDHCLILLEPENNKSRRRRSIPLNETAVAALREIQGWQASVVPGAKWVFQWERGRITTFKTAWKTALRVSGIDDFRIHDLRHTCASWLVMSGVTLQVVKDLLGHSSVTVTEKYAHLAPAETRFAVQKILPF